jgi:hypothetical protein
MALYVPSSGNIPVTCFKSHAPDQAIVNVQGTHRPGEASSRGCIVLGRFVRGLTVRGRIVRGGGTSSGDASFRYGSSGYQAANYIPESLIPYHNSSMRPCWMVSGCCLEYLLRQCTNIYKISQSICPGDQYSIHTRPPGKSFSKTQPPPAFWDHISGRLTLGFTRGSPPAFGM